MVRLNVYLFGELQTYTKAGRRVYCIPQIPIALSDYHPLGNLAESIAAPTPLLGPPDSP